MGGDAAESAGFGRSKHKGDNKVWADFHPSAQSLRAGDPGFSPQPKRRGQFSHLFVARRSRNRLQFAPRASNWGKLAPVVAARDSVNRP